MQSQYTLDVPQALQEEISAFLYRMSVAYSGVQIAPLKAIIQLQVLPVPAPTSTVTLLAPLLTVLPASSPTVLPACDRTCHSTDATADSPANRNSVIEQTFLLSLSLCLHP